MIEGLKLVKLFNFIKGLIKYFYCFFFKSVLYFFNNLSLSVVLIKLCGVLALCDYAFYNVILNTRSILTDVVLPRTAICHSTSRSPDVTGRS